jgi:transcriptional regulator with XRE-family HTH domain
VGTFGQILRQHREARGLSLRQLEGRVPYTFTFISQVERGERRAPEKLASVCDSELEAHGAIIEAYLQEQTGDNDMKRRTVIKALGSLAASPLPLVHWEAIRNGVAAAAGDGLDYEQWESIVDDYGASYYRLSTDQITESLHADITVLQAIIPAAPEATKLSLLKTLSRLSCIVALNMIAIGKILAAHRWWRDSHKYARDSRDPDSVIFSHAWEVVNGCYDGRPPSSVISLADRAVGLINSKKPTAASCGLVAGRAQALSLAGRHEEAISAVRKLGEMAAALPHAVLNDADSLWGWPEHRLRHTEAWVFAHAGELGKAEQAKDRAVELYPRSLLRLRSQVQLHHASALIRNGHIPDGLRLAADVLDELPADQHNGLLRAVAQQVADATPVAERRQQGYKELVDRSA